MSQCDVCNSNDKWLDNFYFVVWSCCFAHSKGPDATDWWVLKAKWLTLCSHPYYTPGVLHFKQAWELGKTIQEAIVFCAAVLFRKWVVKWRGQNQSGLTHKIEFRCTHLRILFRVVWSSTHKWRSFTIHLIVTFCSTQETSAICTPPCMLHGGVSTLLSWHSIVHREH